MKERILTVKGIGKVSVPPDLIIVRMDLKTILPEYSETMKQAAEEIELLRSTLVSIGYDRKDLKTTNFNVNAEYEYYSGSRKRFVGYACSHELKLEFDFDTKRLNETITAISGSKISPKINIQFSVKDKNAVSDELLENAIADAKEKAVILAKAAGVKLGQISRIDYNWGELRFYSDTQYDDCIIEDCAVLGQPSVSMDIEPDDINTKETVSVVWEIE